MRVLDNFYLFDHDHSIPAATINTNHHHDNGDNAAAGAGAGAEYVAAFRWPLVLIVQMLWGQCNIRIFRIMGMTRNVGSRRRLLELEEVVAAMIAGRWLSCSPLPLPLVNALLELDRFQCQYKRQRQVQKRITESNLELNASAHERKSVVLIPIHSSRHWQSW